MKALVVADSDTVIEHVGTVLKTAGYDIITYRTLLKAFDNFEEIAPHLIVISTKAYPRHWKTLAQYATVPLGAYKPQVILYTGGTLDEEEQKKAEALHRSIRLPSMALIVIRLLTECSPDLFSVSSSVSESKSPKKSQTGTRIPDVLSAPGS